MQKENNYLDFSRKVVLVTGSSRGIGNTIARTFSARGAHVVLNGRDLNTVKAAEKEMRADGLDSILSVSADVGNRREVESMFEKINSEFGSVDILINNAALRPYKYFESISDEEWSGVLNTNLTGAFIVSQVAVEEMKNKKHSSIINISSIVANTSPEYYSGVHYASSKGGLISFTRALAKELGYIPIRVNAIVPGVIDTQEDRKEAYEFAAETSFLKRTGSKEEVAQVCLFLASDMAASITGEIVTLGGY
jgi:3-oxoacyl-[acyl-carrier protein] reductase